MILRLDLYPGPAAAAAAAERVVGPRLQFLLGRHI